jgi:hypothetical protein
LVIGYWLFDKTLAINNYILIKYRLTFDWLLKRAGLDEDLVPESQALFDSTPASRLALLPLLPQD